MYSTDEGEKEVLLLFIFIKHITMDAVVHPFRSAITLNTELFAGWLPVEATSGKGRIQIALLISNRREVLKFMFAG